MGARLRCAWPTSWTICASRVSEPTRSARMMNDPVPLMVAPMTLLPDAFSTGIDSPVIMDSSIELRPSRTTPSTGTFSPGRTRSLSPRFDLFERNVFFCAVVAREQARSFRAEIEQRADGGAGAAAGAEFHDLSEQDQRGDGGGGFEVDVRVSAHARDIRRSREKFCGAKVATTL